MVFLFLLPLPLITFFHHRHKIQVSAFSFGTTRALINTRFNDFVSTVFVLFIGLVSLEFSGMKAARASYCARKILVVFLCALFGAEAARGHNGAELIFGRFVPLFPEFRQQNHKHTLERLQMEIRNCEQLAKTHVYKHKFVFEEKIMYIYICVRNDACATARSTRRVINSGELWKMLTNLGTLLPSNVTSIMKCN